MRRSSSNNYNFDSLYFWGKTINKNKCTAFDLIPLLEAVITRNYKLNYSVCKVYIYWPSQQSVLMGVDLPCISTAVHRRELYVGMAEKPLAALCFPKE